MAGNGSFAVTISAVDKASATINRVNRSLAGITAPVEKAQKAVKGFSETGIARGLSAGLKVMTPAAAAIGGLASLDGIAQMMREWGRTGTIVQNGAARIGVSAGHLTAFQGAAQLAGASAEDASGGLTTLRDSLFTAGQGLNPQTLRTMRALHFSLADIKTGAQDVTAFLPTLAGRLASIQDPTQRVAAGTALMGSSYAALDPLVRQGAAAVREYVEEARRHGAMSDENVAKASAFRRAQEGLTQSIDGTKNAILAGLEPALEPLMKDLTGWLDTNRNLVATDVEQWVGRQITSVEKLGATMVRINEQAKPLSDFLDRAGRGENPVAPFVPRPGSTLDNALHDGRLGQAGQPREVAPNGVTGLTPIERMLLGDGSVAPPPNMAAGPRAYRVQDGAALPGPRAAPDSSSLLYPGQGTQSTGQQRNLRNNNPTNLDFANQPGASTDGRFAIFKNMESGVAADLNQFLRYQESPDWAKRNGGVQPKSIRQMIGIATPQTENPYVQGYINRVSKDMGMGPDDVPNLRDPAISKRWITAVSGREGGTPDPGAVSRGVDLRLGSAPPSIRTTPSQSDPARDLAPTMGKDAANAYLPRPIDPNAPKVDLSEPPMPYVPDAPKSDPFRNSDPARDLHRDYQQTMGGSAGGGTVTVDINHNAAPAGVSATATGSGNVSVSPVKVVPVMGR